LKAVEDYKAEKTTNGETVAANKILNDKFVVGKTAGDKALYDKAVLACADKDSKV